MDPHSLAPQYYLNIKTELVTRPLFHSAGQACPFVFAYVMVCRLDCNLWSISNWDNFIMLAAVYSFLL